VPHLLFDQNGLQYRVLHCEPSPDASRARFILSVELAGADVRERSIAFGLTPREARIAELLAQRATNTEIADELGISCHTVRHHTERVLTKLGVRSRVDVREKLLSQSRRSTPPQNAISRVPNP